MLPNEAFFKGDDPILVNYNSFRDQFGRDDLILVGNRHPRGLQHRVSAQTPSDAG